MQCRGAEELVGTTFPMQSGGTDQVANAPDVIRLPHLKSMGAEPLAHGGLPLWGLPTLNDSCAWRVNAEYGLDYRVLKLIEEIIQKTMGKAGRWS